MKILLYPDARLIAKNVYINEVTPDVKTKVREMFDLMYATNGVGLAAPQVGWNVKLFVVNVTGKKDDELAFINPFITTQGDMVSEAEGCLSFPGIYADIRRPSDVTVKAMSIDGGMIDGSFTGLLSRAIQHENDHLDSMLFIERFTPAQERLHSLALKRLRYPGGR